MKAASVFLHLAVLLGDRERFQPAVRDALGFCPPQVPGLRGWTQAALAQHAGLSTRRGSACAETRCERRAGCSWTGCAAPHLTSAAEQGTEPRVYLHTAIIRLFL